MNLLLLEKHDIDPRPGPVARAVLDDRRAKHIVKVLGLAVGDTLRCGVIGDHGAAGARGTGTVRAIEDGRVTLELQIDSPKDPRTRALDDDPDDDPDDDRAFDTRSFDERALDDMADVELILGMPRPPVLHRVLQHVTTFGISRLYLSNAWRVEKSYFQSPSLEAAAIRRQLILGAEQGRRTRLPEVSLEKLLVPFLRSLGSRDSPRAAAECRLIAHPGAETPIEQAVAHADAAKRHVLAIGPEGGWIDRELETFAEHGFQAVSLGPWILRSEAAVNASLAQLAVGRRMARRR